MTPDSDIFRKYLELVAELNRHAHAYHVQDAPTISDKEYDEKYRELERIEAEHPDLKALDSPTLRVGGEPLEGFTKVAHTEALLSLENSYSLDEIREFIERAERVLGAEVDSPFFVEPTMPAAG